MNKGAWITLLWLVLTSGWGWSGSLPEITTPQDHPERQVEKERRITVSGSRFIRDGVRIRLKGVNTPWNHWNEFGHAFDPQWWRDHFSALAAIGVDSVNVWISCDGWNPSPGITDSGLVSLPTERFWQDLDQLFEIAQEHRLYLMLTLISFDHSKPGSPNSEAWQKMYGSEVNRISFIRNYVMPLVLRYRDNPYFFAVNVGCELEWVWELHGVKQKDVLDLVARVALAVHESSDVLVCHGLGAGVKYNSPIYEGNPFSDEALGMVHQGAFLDFYNIHYYDWQNQWFGNPFEKTPEEYRMGEKPCLIGEYRAKGAAGYSPAQCLLRAFSNNWQGVMVWSSNGVDPNGSIDDFKDAFIRFRPEENSSLFQGE